MKVRIITSIVAVLLILPFLYFSDTFMLPVLAGILTVIALGEMLHCIGMLTRPAVSVPVFLFGAGLLTATRLLGMDRWIRLFFILLYLLIVYLMTAAVFSRGKLQITDAAMVLMTTVYITLGFSSLVLLRDMPFGNYFYLVPMLTAWGSDIFAYFTGYFFGRHKLIPDVSPKKTVEGAIGGVVLGTAFLVLYGFIIGRLTEAEPDYFALVLSGVLLTIVSQCGDLVASLIKRHYQIKDYGKILPGHGGVMDRFDSVIAVSALMLILFIVSPVFTIFV